MENSKIPPFYVGQKVVHVGEPFGILGNKTIHTVTGVHQTPCGCFIIDVDNEGFEKIKTYLSTCDQCGAYVTTTHQCVRGYYPIDFRPLQESKFRAITFEKIMEETEKICVN